MADVITRGIYEILKGLTITYTLYPVVGTGVASGATVTAGAGAWGASKEIIPANTIPTDFFVCAMDLDTASAAEAFVIGLQEAGATDIFYTRVNPTAVTVNLGRVGIPFPRRSIANTQITGKASGAAADSINVSVLVATGLP